VGLVRIARFGRARAAARFSARAAPQPRRARRAQLHIREAIAMADSPLRVTCLGSLRPGLVRNSSNFPRDILRRKNKINVPAGDRALRHT
jgi:hypothetical protein